VSDIAYAKSHLRWARERHAERRALAVEFRSRVNLNNPLIERELRELEIDAGYAEHEWRDAKAALEAS
jgi:hypothetical protein